MKSKLDVVVCFASLLFTNEDEPQRASFYFTHVK
jgi:hypothetical protein